MLTQRNPGASQPTHHFLADGKLCARVFVFELQAASPSKVQIHGEKSVTYPSLSVLLLAQTSFFPSTLYLFVYHTYH